MTPVAFNIAKLGFFVFHLLVQLYSLIKVFISLMYKYQLGVAI